MADRGTPLAGLEPAHRPSTLLGLATGYVEQTRGPGAAATFRRRADRRIRPAEAWVRQVADHFEQQPPRLWTPELADGYAAFQAENLAQFRRITAAGLRIEPWRRPGQPYRDSDHLRGSVAASGRLYVYLTSSGHGSRPARDDHPMRRPAGIRVAGVDFLHNDVYRAVHDVFGHLMTSYGMGLFGELRAAHSHLSMYSPRARAVLFTEQVSQVCWFFRGPHLRDSRGRFPAAGTPGWVPPRERPFPAQKVFPCPPLFLAAFAGAPSEEATAT